MGYSCYTSPNLRHHDSCRCPGVTQARPSTTTMLTRLLVPCNVDHISQHRYLFSMECSVFVFSPQYHCMHQLLYSFVHHFSSITNPRICSSYAILLTFLTYWLGPDSPHFVDGNFINTLLRWDMDRKHQPFCLGLNVLIPCYYRWARHFFLLGISIRYRTRPMNHKATIIWTR